MSEHRGPEGADQFLLPPCSGEVSIELGPSVAVIRFPTLAGQTLGVPMPIEGLAHLARAIVEALSDHAPEVQGRPPRVVTAQDVRP